MRDQPWQHALAAARVQPARGAPPVLRPRLARVVFSSAMCCMIVDSNTDRLV